MKRTIAILGALACLSVLTPACRHTEIHERPVVAQPAPSAPHPAVARSGGSKAKPAKHPTPVSTTKNHPKGRPTARAATPARHR